MWTEGGFSFRFALLCSEAKVDRYAIFLALMFSSGDENVSFSGHPHKKE